MYFQTAGIEVEVWIPPLVAFGISFLTSMGGVSGAFLLLPFQMSVLGYTDPSVSATNQFYNIVAIPSGVYRYCREGRMVWPLAWTVAAGTMPGVFIGAFLRVTFLPKASNFKLFAAAVLLYIGLRMITGLSAKKIGPDKASGEKRLKELLRRPCPPPSESGAGRAGADPSPAVRITRFTWKRLGYSFYDECFDVSVWAIFLLCFVVGIIGGIYGIGGGAIVAPFLITFFDLPVHTIAGAALMGTFVASIAGVASYQILAPFYPHMSVAPDWLLGLLFGLGGMAGIYLGARCQKYVPARLIKVLLVLIILFTAVSYIIDFFR